jgi:hypothetical protein
MPLHLLFFAVETIGLFAVVLLGSQATQYDFVATLTLRFW